MPHLWLSTSCSSTLQNLIQAETFYVFIYQPYKSYYKKLSHVARDVNCHNLAARDERSFEPA